MFLNMTKVAVIVGSLRENSFSQRWADNLANMLPEGYEAFFPEIGDLPLYNEDFDGEGKDTPEEYTRFREEMADADAVIIMSPEYNRNMPAAVKNALDVGSRPYGSSIWDGKPALVATHSISGISGFGANHDIRQSLVFLNMPVLQQPEVYLANSQDLIDDEGKIVGEGTEEFLQGAVNSFVDFIEKLI